MMMIVAVKIPWLLRQTIIKVREQRWILDPWGLLVMMQSC